MKNLVLCLDGTSNEFAHDATNVVKLFAALVHDDRQATYYHPGVGTMEPTGALLPISRRITRLLGLAFGYGLLRDIDDAYRFLMNNYEAGDRVFLFGFSRGAFTARALASLLHMYGLINRGNEPLVAYAIRMMRGFSRHRRNEKDAQLDFELARNFKKTFSTRECKPWFVGVWDTVSSVGWVENPLYLPYTANNPDIEHGRHAVAIDERRAFFRTNLWRPAAQGPTGPKTLKQVWFAGVHCDVGGGFPATESRLANISLAWMAAEAETAGLLIDPEHRRRLIEDGTPGPVPAPTHESLRWYWWPAELLLKRHFNWKKKRWARRMNLGRRRTIPAGSMVHSSVLRRGDYNRKRLPADVITAETVWPQQAAAP